ncbi:MAG TPA: DUF3090 family protein [Ktedonobacteraceae bacterium]|nr:DUF3090 family protein [Ktedonobacteraceae bacterium]
MSKDLGPIDIVGAEAIGQPGQRRFRLFAMIHNISIALWMEKEQLNDLSIVLDRILAQLTEGRILRTEAQASPPAPPRAPPANFPANPEFEFQVGQLRISYDDRRNLLVLTSIPLGIVMEPGQEPQVILRDDDTLSFRFTLQQARELARSITILVSSGRPTCPLCKAPLDGGPHACVKQNGHRKLVQALEDEVEDSEDE